MAQRPINPEHLEQPQPKQKRIHATKSQALSNFNTISKRTYTAIWHPNPNKEIE
jgi:hypothetical protein